MLLKSLELYRGFQNQNQSDLITVASLLALARLIQVHHLINMISFDHIKIPIEPLLFYLIFDLRSYAIWISNQSFSK